MIIEWTNFTVFQQEVSDETGLPIGRPKYVKGWSSAPKEFKKPKPKKAVKKVLDSEAPTITEGSLF